MKRKSGKFGMLAAWGVTERRTGKLRGLLLMLVLGPLFGLLTLTPPVGLMAQSHSAARTAKKKVKLAAKHSAAKNTSTKKAAANPGHIAARHLPPRKTAAAAKHSSAPHSAFVASSELRPMAQQLSSGRSAQAYAGVLNYAHSHTGEPAAAAWLALGHAYWLDKKYPDAYNSFQLARQKGVVLNDYAEYLGAQAALQMGRAADAVTLLNGFAARHPESVFTWNAPVKLAAAELQLNDPAAALRILTAMDGQPVSNQAEFMNTEARAYQASGKSSQAAGLYHKLVDTLPLSPEAAGVEGQLRSVGAPLSVAELKARADALFAAKRYNDAEGVYRELEHEPAARGAGNFAVYAAACNLKMKSHWLNPLMAEQLPDSQDDSGALRLYIMAELNRSEDDRTREGEVVQQMIKRFPSSRWTHEALYSAGNAAMLKREYPNAIRYYTTVVELFPNGSYAPSSHWRAAWLNYRLRNYSVAAKMFDEQLVRYGGGLEIPSALYWRARIYEDEEHNYAQAENYYSTLSNSYPNYYYGILARQRLAALPVQAVTPAAELGYVRQAHAPAFTDVLPTDDEHLEKAKLLANAALNEYIAPEIQLSAGSSTWGLYAQAEIYRSFGEDYRALQTIKKSPVSFFALPIRDVPMSYWHLLFPLPYWPDLSADAQRMNLDPYLVAALARQESEFNPGIVSHANAYGLMQLLPAVGRQLAKKDGVKKLDASQLLQPATNLRYGTMYLRGTLDRFNGQAELALAAYNAGDTPVHAWQANGNFKDLPEFVESIPYTETRDYVQAVLRNREMYSRIYGGKGK